MPKRSKTESAKSKVESAVALGGLGASIGGPVGAGIGAGLGLIIGDDRIVFPLDMVAIPAYQAYMIDGSPSLQIYIRAGETLMPTGGNVDDVQEADPRMAFEPIPQGVDAVAGRSRKRPLTAYQKRYKKAFKKVAPKFKKKDGTTWKVNGFQRAVNEAHKIARGKK